MIKNVKKDYVEYNNIPYIFEAGTPNISEIIGLGKAIDFILGLGFKDISKYEENLNVG